MRELLKQIITSHSGVSSKRVCGVLGFLVISFVLIYCTICSIQAPEMIDTFIYAVSLLLGIDSVMGPFYQNSKNGKLNKETIKKEEKHENNS